MGPASVTTTETASAVQALPATTPLKSGQYRIDKLLGQGGFGITYSARDTSLRRDVAIKEFFLFQGCARRAKTVLPPSTGSTSAWVAARERFLTEARVLARFQHPSIVTVFESFEEHNTAYMVMELLRGRTLAELGNRKGPLREDELLRFVEQVAAALKIVHAANYLHRDIKPENIMVTGDGRAVLIDFGIAREFALDRSVRMTGTLTLGYAPLELYPGQGETAASARFGPPADIYMLGATMYHLLTGEIPVDALRRFRGVDLKAPLRLVPSVSRVVSEAVMWAMGMEAPDRPQTIDEFMGALSGHLTPRQSTFGGRAATSFKFRSAEAWTIRDLLGLCDRFPDEAQDHLFNGYIERWLAEGAGDPVLAQQARQIQKGYARDTRRGLELFAREVCTRASLSPQELDPKPAHVDLGKLPRGARTAGHIEIRVKTRGYAWGTVSVVPSQGALTSVDAFDTSASRCTFQVDTAFLEPGPHRFEVTFQAHGVPSPTRVPVTFEVTPVSATLTPRTINLGAVQFGEQRTARITVNVEPANGRIVGTVSLSRKLDGVTTSSSVDGASGAVEIIVDTTLLEAGHTYATSISLDTNVGRFDVPIRFRTILDRRTVARWTIGCGLGLSAGLAFLRAGFATVAPSLTRWFTVMPSSLRELQTDMERSVACGILGLVVIGVAGIWIWSRRTKSGA